MSRGGTFGALLDDLVAEEQSLDDLVGALDDAGWSTPTPAEGWTVSDQVAHLAAAEEWATLALTDADAFRAELERLNDDAETRAEELRRGLLARRPPPGADTLTWWRQGRTATLDRLRDHEPKDRLPWFGPDMSAMSFATARLMETWAHGVDVADALGVPPVATARLRHVADLGVRTRGFAYVSRDLEVPTTPIRIDLAAPEDDDVWSWGPAGAPDSVLGPALDFCLVVTQRRHPSDTDLHVTGRDAAEWIAIAQAFAGAPTGQRAPSGGRTPRG
jgi:uncharacterized protein (TIGR03084 family)